MVAKNWDEYSIVSFEKNPCPPNQCRRVWPDHLNRYTIEKLLPLLMNHYPLQHNASITIKLFGGYMVFKMEIEEDYSHDRSQVYQYNSSIPISLAIKSSSQLDRHILPSANKVHYQFHEHAIDKIFSNVFPSSDMSSSSLHSRLFHHTIQISGPVGSGKTMFLHQLLAEIQRNRTNKGNNSLLVETYYYDLKSLPTDIDTIIQIQENLVFMESFLRVQDAFQQSLSFVISQLFFSQKEQKKHVEDESKNRIVVYAIDSLEVLYQPFLKDSDPDMEALPYYLEDYYRLLAYHLQVICSYLQASSVSERLHIYFLGATSLPINRIPKSSLGCFQMELNLPLPKPSFVDRCRLCYQLLVETFPNDSLQALRPDCPSWMLKEIQTIFSLYDVLEREQNRYIWSYRLAGLTQGYLPGDLSTFMRKLQSQSLLKIRKPEQECVENIPRASCDWDLVLSAIATNSLQAIDELDTIEQYAELSSHLTWDSFIGFGEAIRDIQSLLRPLLKPSFATESGPPSFSSSLLSPAQSTSLLTKYRFPKGMVLHGPSGCGKTYLAKIISRHLRANLIPIQSADILSKYFGETEAKVRKYFSIAHQIAPCVLFFDEFDALAHRRDFQNASESSHGSIFNRILSTFLNELDGIALPSTQSFVDASSSFVFVIVACKSLDLLDEALLRPGRLQYHIHLDYPTEEDVAVMLHQELSPFQFEMLPSHLNQICQIPSLTLAIVREFIERIKLQAIKDRIESSVKGGVAKPAIIEEKHWRLAIQDYLSLDEIDSPPPPQVLSFTSDFSGTFSFHSGI